MGRKITDTVEYFPHIAKSGKTIYILESRWGNDGYAFWFKLLETLCVEEGLCLDCSNPTTWQYLLARTRVSEITGSEILEMLASLGNIDSELWTKSRIIWCQKLIDHLKDVYTRRGRPAPSRPSSLHNSDCLPQKSTSDVISEPETPQSKVNKSKVDKSIAPPTPSEPTAELLQFLSLKCKKPIDVTRVEAVKSMIAEFGIENVRRAILKAEASAPAGFNPNYLLPILADHVRDGKWVEKQPSHSTNRGPQKLATADEMKKELKEIYHGRELD